MANSSYYNGSSYVHLLESHPIGWKFTEESKQGLLHYKFEEIDHFYWTSVAETQWFICVYASAIYLAAIFGLQRWMKNREAYDLRGTLFLWNATIGIFSILGFWRTAPSFVRVISKPGGFYRSICERKDAEPQLIFWVLLFGLSKFVELGDTVFIVLRKRPLIFLQWWHHLVTMFAGWTIGPYIEPFTRWIVVFNFGVHSLMYPYFAARALGVKMPVYIPNFLTTIQLGQMIVVSFVNLLSMAYYLSGQDCARHPISILACSVVGLSFVFLWGKLFNESVVKNGRAQREKAKTN